MPLAGAVLYELHVGTFTPAGTFDGAIERLDHLVELGVDAVELMPVAEFPGDHGWGYDGVDLFAPHHAYGGPDGLKRLVDACHAAASASCSTSSTTTSARPGTTSPSSARTSPTATARPGATPSTSTAPAATRCAASSSTTRCMWLRDYHVDGLRLDAVHAIVDSSAVHILEELARRGRRRSPRSVGRPLFLIAESDRNDPRLVRGRDAGGYGLDAQWADDFHHALHAALTGERDGYYEDFGSLDDARQGARARRGSTTARWSRVRERRPRPAARPGLAGDRFVVCMQNHDQVGNRAAGERLAAAHDDRSG